MIAISRGPVMVMAITITIMIIIGATIIPKTTIAEPDIERQRDETGEGIPCGHQRGGEPLRRRKVEMAVA